MQLTSSKFLFILQIKCVKVLGKFARFVSLTLLIFNSYNGRLFKFTKDSYVLWLTFKYLKFVSLCRHSTAFNEFLVMSSVTKEVKFLRKSMLVRLLLKRVNSVKLVINARQSILFISLLFFKVNLANFVNFASYLIHTKRLLSPISKHYKLESLEKQSTELRSLLSRLRLFKLQSAVKLSAFSMLLLLRFN